MDVKPALNVDIVDVDKEDSLPDLVAELTKEECDHYYQCYETTCFVNRLRCYYCGHETTQFRNLYPGYQ